MLNAALLDAVTTDERGRLIVAVPADTSSAALSLFISCNPHLRVGIALELEPSAVNGSVSVGY